ncbi:MAG: hypothetical protein DRJ63_03785 [Thermoprotei archaeon]|nr:MAG: hypothetical protein DRJ63_03785 [Thermoprotei archaeon]
MTHSTIRAAVRYLLGCLPYFKLPFLGLAGLSDCSCLSGAIRDLLELQLLSGAFPSGWSKVHGESTMATAKALLCISHLSGPAEKAADYLERSLSAYGFWRDDPLQLSLFEDFLSPRDYTATEFVSSIMAALSLRRFGRKVAVEKFLSAVSSIQDSSGTWFSQGTPSVLITSLLLIFFGESLDARAKALRGLKKILASSSPRVTQLERALGLLALAKVDVKYLSPALEYLASIQCREGGWGKRRSSPACTFLILSAMLELEKLRPLVLEELEGLLSRLVRLRRVVSSSHGRLREKLLGLLRHCYVIFPESTKETLFRVFALSVLFQLGPAVDAYEVFEKAADRMRYSNMLHDVDEFLSCLRDLLLSRGVGRRVVYNISKSIRIFGDFLSEIDFLKVVPVEKFSEEFSRYILFKAAHAIENYKSLGVLLYLYRRRIFDEDSLLVGLQCLPGVGRFSADMFLFLSCDILEIIRCKRSFLPVSWSIVKPLLMTGLLSAKVVSAYRTTRRIYETSLNLLSTVMSRDLWKAYYLTEVSRHWCFKRTCRSIKGPCPLYEICAFKYG